MIDDGSTDRTASVVSELAAGWSHPPVRYIHKENGGKHTAVNRGVVAARGSFCAVLDHDDWYAPQCLDRLQSEWGRIPNPRAFAEVQGLCATPDGKVVGSPFARDVFDSDYHELTYVLGLGGDRIGMHRTEVLREYPFPEQFGDAYIPEAIVWNRIARRYRTRCINETLAYKEYLDGGLGSQSASRHVELAGPRLLLVEELLEMPRRLPVGVRLRAYANLSRYAFHQGRALRTQAARAPSPALWALALPLGLALAARDKL